MYIGVDVGGTNLVAGVVDKNGCILEKVSAETASFRGRDALVADIVALIKKAFDIACAKGAAPVSVGLGIPGAVDNNEGSVIFCPNIPIADFPLAKVIEERCRLPAHLLNDADAAAYGEAHAGSAKGCQSMILITLGTGIGGGIVVDGKILNGFNGIGGEVGHMVIEYGGKPCNCGRGGCWERYASASGLIMLVKEKMEKDENKASVLWEVAPSLDDVNGRTAFAAAERNDALALEIISLFTDYLACGLANLINIFQPEVVCLGGGVSNAGDALLRPLKEKVAKSTFQHPKMNTEIRIATLGNDAGIIGAALARIV